MPPLRCASGIQGLRRTTSFPAAAAPFHSTAHLTKRTRPRIHSRKRNTPTPGPWWKPFELTEVVLDLDSYESNYTRPYDKAEEVAQTAKWKSDPRKDAMGKRIDKLEADYKDAKKKLEIIQSKSWQPWRVTDLDIMTAALQGAPKRPGREIQDVDSAQLEVVDKNGIPSSVCKDDERLLEWLIHRKHNARSWRLGAEELSRLLEEPTSAREFQRLLSRFLTSDQSHETIANNATAIATVISDALCRLERPVELLPIVNSFNARCELHGYPMGLSLCHEGMRLSAEAFRLWGLQNYIEHAFSHRYGVEPVVITEVMRTLQKEVLLRESQEQSGGGSDLQSFEGPRLNLRTWKSKIFRILTGAPKKGNPDKTKPCFRKIIEKKPDEQELNDVYQELLATVRPLPQDIVEADSRSGQ
ncbi:hypothetical protein CcaCcLH18_13327 [Colletotrichum camelliae]|nr:hypothetical protein CcaCcLH18_13327 [Colletotrichum camelliae]